MPPSEKYEHAIHHLRTDANKFARMAEVEKHDANRATYRMLAADFTAAAAELEKIQ
jgi:hypothetical protein